jgi:hypothetical protein
MANLSQPDDNMVPGQTYTFQLNQTGIAWLASAADVQNALTANAPNFLSNLQVTSPFTTSLYDCQFTYTGDGSDVVSDVANSIVGAANQGTGKTFVFVGAVPDTASKITISPGNAAAKIGSAVSDAINNAADSTSKAAAKAAQNLLTPVEIAVGILAIIVIAIIFTAGKSGGVNVSEFGASVGGSK